MTHQANLSLAQLLIDRIAQSAPAEELAALASPELVFQVQGDPTSLPWVGEVKHGRQALADFIRGQRELIRSEAFKVDDILASADRAVILGELTSTLKATGRTLQQQFAIVLSIVNGEITRFQLLEDSFAVSQASH